MTVESLMTDFQPIRKYTTLAFKPSLSPHHAQPFALGESTNDTHKY